MSDLTPSAQSLPTPAHHSMGEADAGSRSAAQLCRHLQDCSTLLASFSRDLFQEINDIRSVLSPGTAAHGLGRRSPSSRLSVETVPIPVTVSQPTEVPSNLLRSFELVPESTKPEVCVPEADDHSRLAAIKARISARLRSEAHPVDLPLHAGGQQ